MTNDTDHETAAPANDDRPLRFSFVLLYSARYCGFWSEQIAEVMEMLELAYGDRVLVTDANTIHSIKTSGVSYV